jgi:hypothetical protein
MPKIYWNKIKAGESNQNVGKSTECPTRYGTRHFFNNSNTNKDIATKF